MTDIPNDQPLSDAAAGFAKEQLKSFIERIERLEEEKKTIADDIKDVFAEAKGNGFCVKALREILKIRKQDADQRAEHEAIVDLYLQALDMLQADCTVKSSYRPPGDMIFGGPKEWSEYISAHSKYAIQKCESLKGRIVTLLSGKYKGRKAQITSITSDRDGLLFLAQPFNLVNGELLWDDPQARTYRRYVEIDWS